MPGNQGVQLDMSTSVPLPQVAAAAAPVKLDMSTSVPLPNTPQQNTLQNTTGVSNVPQPASAPTENNTAPQSVGQEFINSHLSSNPTLRSAETWLSSHLGTNPKEAKMEKEMGEHEVLGQPLLPMGATALTAAQFGGGVLGGAGMAKGAEYAAKEGGLTPTETAWARDISGIIGSIIGSGAGAQAEESAIAPLVAKAEAIWSGLKNRLANEVYTPEGELTPVANAIVHPTKLPETVLRKMIPENPENVASRLLDELYEKEPDVPTRAKAEMDKDIGAGQQERAAAKAQMNKDILDAQQERAAAKTDMERQIADEKLSRASARNEMYENLASARNARPAEPSPGTSEFYEKRADDLMRRAKQQASLDKEAAREARIKERASVPKKTIAFSASEGSSSSPESVRNLPEATLPVAPNAATTSTSTNPDVQVEIKTPLSPKTTGKPKIIQPGTPEAQPQPIKGSFWSYPEPELKKAVLSGDREAAVVYRMRYNTLPEGAKYLTDVTDSIIKGLYKSSGTK